MKPVQMELAPKGKKRVCLEIHRLSVPAGCCPVSKNPFPGSTLSLAYFSLRCLEVGSLSRYLHSFVGGKKDEEGTIILRDMEGMISEIANEAARRLHTFTFVSASLVIKPEETMILYCIGYPWCRSR